ncbi:unnamed protein product [Ectocarpus fasciculatus]
MLQQHSCRNAAEPQRTRGRVREFAQQNKKSSPFNNLNHAARANSPPLCLSPHMHAHFQKRERLMGAKEGQQQAWTLATPLREGARRWQPLSQPGMHRYPLSLWFLRTTLQVASC